MAKKKTTIYKVERAIWGKDKNQKLFFADKETAQKFAEKDYCSYCGSYRTSEQNANVLLASTKYELSLY